MTLGGGESGGTVRVGRNVISDDGTRVVWSASGGLYLRDMESGHEQTVQLGGRGAVFQTASADDSRVFFTDEKGLTADSAAQAGSPDLYECEIVEEADELKCKLSDLTPAGSGEAIQAVQGVPGVSEDGAYAYFVAENKPGGCVESQAEADCDLYVHHAGTTRLIAVLSGADAPDWSYELNKL